MMLGNCSKINIVGISLLFLIILPYLIIIHDFSYVYNIPMVHNPVYRNFIIYNFIRVNAKNAQKAERFNPVNKQYATSLTAGLNQFGILDHYLICVQCRNLTSSSLLDSLFQGHSNVMSPVSSLIVINNFNHKIFHPPKHNTFSL